MKIHCLLGLGVSVLLYACGNRGTDYDASGIFETTEIIVSAQSQGELIEFNAEEGKQVKAGEYLGFVDTLQLSLKKKQLCATLSATGSKWLDEKRQLASIKKQITNLQREKKRFSDLLKADAATEKQVDEINYQIEVLKQQLSAAEEQISSNNKSLDGQSSSIEAQLAQIENQIENSIISSPSDGTVLTKYAEPGEYVLPGRALFKVGNLENMKLRVYITGDQLTSLKIGQKVKVYADRGKDENAEYEGIVSWISDEAEFTPKTIQTRDERANLVYAVKIDVKNDGLIKRGMYGDVKF